MFGSGPKPTDQNGRFWRRADIGQAADVGQVPDINCATTTSVHSPNLNPIDKSSKFEPLLRKAVAGSAETNCITIGEILRAITPSDCANYFRNSAHAQS
jgi:hypothetical protein